MMDLAANHKIKDIRIPCSCSNGSPFPREYGRIRDFYRPETHKRAGFSKVVGYVTSDPQLVMSAFLLVDRCHEERNSGAA